MRIEIAHRGNLSKLSHKLKVPHAIISVVGTINEKKAYLHLPCTGLKALLRLTFDDIVEENKMFRLMSDNDADQIIDFVERWAGEIEVMICQCNAGLCRSTAIAAAIAKRFRIEEINYFNCPPYSPNFFVYNKLLEKWGYYT